MNAAWSIITASAYNWSIGHQGLMIDPESGLIYNRMRYLSSAIGAFTSRDPKGYADGMNLLQYVGSSPMNRIDPTGRERQQEIARCCGPDITNILKTIASSLLFQWNASSYFQQALIYAYSISPSGIAGWDITPLLYGGATTAACRDTFGPCTKTVTVAGKCYSQIAVNYWLAGLMDSVFDSGLNLFGSEFQELVYVYVYGKRAFRLDLSSPGEKIAWYRAGKANNLTTVPQPARYANCQACTAPPDYNSPRITWRVGDYMGGPAD
jgi:RHS repeat-associated protein